MASFGDRIKERLNKVGLSQKELADALNIHKNTVNSWVKNTKEPGIKMAYNMCFFLECSIDWLVTGYEKSALDAYRKASERAEKVFSQSIDLDGEGHTVNQNFGSGSLRVNDNHSKYVTGDDEKNIEIVEKYLKLKETDRKAVATLIESLSRKGD